MIYEIELGGACGKKGFLNPVVRPDGKEVLDFLENYRYEGGYFEVNFIKPPDVGPQHIQVQSDLLDNKQAYFITLLDNLDKSGCNSRVKTALNQKNSDKIVEFLGNFYNHRALVDFDYMQKVVLEFAETGDVSRKLLD